MNYKSTLARRLIVVSPKFVEAHKYDKKFLSSCVAQRVGFEPTNLILSRNLDSLQNRKHSSFFGSSFKVFVVQFGFLSGQYTFYVLFIYCASVRSGQLVYYKILCRNKPYPKVFIYFGFLSSAQSFIIKN